MEQKVKLQFTSNLEDVSKLSSLTLEEALANISLLQLLINETKTKLWSVDISVHEERDSLKSLLLNLDNARFLLSKIDMRLGDVSSVVSGLNSIFEPKEEEKDKKDDSVSAG